MITAKELRLKLIEQQSKITDSIVNESLLSLEEAVDRGADNVSFACPEHHITDVSYRLGNLGYEVKPLKDGDSYINQYQLIIPLLPDIKEYNSKNTNNEDTQR